MVAGTFTGSAVVTVVVVVVVVVSCAAARPVSANAVSMRIFFITKRILGVTVTRDYTRKESLKEFINK
ncbi:hypothetical protein GCM10017782_26580 [Deinococcus ficus]|nr:hypothetical protein GCM10017782_26580 [Deinococcus ficus]